MAAANILVVDDDPAIHRLLCDGFEAAGWSARTAINRKTLFAALREDTFDLITLDLSLGQEDGLEIAREIRAVRNIPILMITGRATPFDRLRGLECGADDYVVKPFHIREVILRVQKILDIYRRDIGGDASVLFDHSSFDPKRRIVERLDGSPVELTDIELRLLELLVRHPGRVLSRDEISQALFGRDWSPLDRTIDGHVARLRKKIEPAGEVPSLIRSVRGVGYVFTGEIRTGPRQDPEPGEPPAPAASSDMA
ncbi:response regulator [Rhodobacterales bacterium HKCCE3408]|nr:response regulator [Rhodobacterales bacterium HKCCE3408]